MDGTAQAAAKPAEDQTKVTKLKQKNKTTPEEKEQAKNKEREERAAVRKQRLDKKIERASRPDTVVISRTTLDTTEMANLVQSNDYLMFQLRRKIGYKKELTPQKFEELFNRSMEIKQEIHEFNIELSKITGERYIPPRGFTGNQQD